MKYPWLPALLLIYPVYLFLATHWPLIPPAVSAEGIRRDFTPQQLQYFSETAFENEKPLKRWTGDIRIQVIGEASPEEQRDVSAAIRELQALKLPIRIALVPTDGNIPVSFLEKALFEAQYSDERPIPIGFVRYGRADFNGIRGARIFVRTDIEAALKKRVLRHELCHALGLPNHSPSYYPIPNFMGKQVMDMREYDAFQQGNTRFCALDSAALALLYHPDIPPGCRWKTFQQATGVAKTRGVRVHF